MTREEKGATRYRAMFRHYPDALTPAQVQEMLGIGRRMVYGLLRRGEIQSVRCTVYLRSRSLTISAR